MPLRRILRYKRVRFVTRKRKEKLLICKGWQVRGERGGVKGEGLTPQSLRDSSPKTRGAIYKLLSPCVRETRGEASERVSLTLLKNNN